LDLSSETATFGDVLAEIIKKEKEADADAVSLEQLVDHIKLEGPLFRVRFAEETGDADVARLTSLTTDMALSVSSSGSGLQLKLAYNQMLFSQRRIELLLESLCQLVLSAAGAPTSAMSVLPLRALDSASQAVLPDPKSDLDWCGFKGAITDIFSANARAHPDKPCVVQSSSSTSLIQDLAASIATVTSLGGSASGASQNRTTYTYKQIDEASNVLGHALKKAGLQRGEVVMVYAARSVELLCCVMGVLKAGGVFSVIDPAYPPNRQTVYLDVSKPRALLIISSAGVLHPAVSEYIETKLDLRLQIPAISLDESGVIRGSPTSSSTDILDEYRSFASTPVGVVLGPDSHATLSFTSGSTGIPKGVKGRHYSLTHFFPWMSERFGLSKGERFTMLSGIAHDPIQRDSKSATRGVIQGKVAHRLDLHFLQSLRRCSWERNSTCPLQTILGLLVVWPSVWLIAR